MKRRLHPQGSGFSFTPENLKKCYEAINQYPPGRQASAVKTLLHMAQEQNNGWISQEVVEEIAHLLDMPFIRVYEVVSFYTLFQLTPPGRVHVKVCTTTPCWLRGADDLLHVCQKRAALEGEKALTVEEVECLGACVNAPVVQIDHDFYEDLTEKTLDTVLEGALKGTPCQAGSQSGRFHSAPQDYKPGSKKTSGGLFHA
jgi:NADH-quinone oxidoreductase subunit E